MACTQPGHASDSQASRCSVTAIAYAIVMMQSNADAMPAEATGAQRPRHQLQHVYPSLSSQCSCGYTVEQVRVACIYSTDAEG